MEVSNNQLHLELHTEAGDARPVYIVGNFNDWQPADPLFQFKQVRDGVYSFSFPKDMILPAPLEYKYTRGDWDHIALDEYGNLPVNRVISQPKGQFTDRVLHWKKDGLNYEPKFLPIKDLLAKDFEIPQLGKKRRILALLPYDYHEQTKSYPVLYLQDAQNLFDEHSPYGNWGIDKKLAILAKQQKGDLIIIAIDHGEQERIKEFTPTNSTKLGPGDGKKYVRFIADTLKPHVDKKYRTLPDRLHTGVGGSSMGGLISIYAGLMYPEVYGKLMIFSPSLWVTPNIPFGAIGFYNPYPTDIYLYAGSNESKYMVPNANKFKKTLEKQGIDDTAINFKLTIDPLGRHTEARWGTEFPRAVDWLFFNKTLR